jgi:hypothetical protein
MNVDPKKNMDRLKDKLLKSKINFVIILKETGHEKAEKG